MTSENSDLAKARELIKAIENAIDTVARHVVRSAVFDGITGGKIGWEDYPELGEHDWEAVSFCALQLADEMDLDRLTYIAAYELLEKRAKAATDRD